MKRRALLASLLVACLPGVGSSYTRPRHEIEGVIYQARWTTPDPIPVVVNIDELNSIVAGSRPLLAVRNMFETRSAYSPVRFAPVQGSAPESIGFDGTNLVTFKDTTVNRSVAAGFAGYCLFWGNLVDGVVVVTESDVVFNAAYDHTTTGTGGQDIEALGGHEVAHFLAFDHSGVVGATASPNFGVSDHSARRSLSLDDRAGLEYLYPFSDSAARNGTLSGMVLETGAGGIFGAQVVAVRTSDGEVVSEIAVDGGLWRIDGLPPGSYRVYAEPLDGPNFPSDLVSGIYRTRTYDTTFRTQFAGTNDVPTTYAVTAGGTISGITISASGAAPTLNPRYHGLSPNGTFPVLGWVLVTVTQGTSAYLVVGGPGISAVPNNGVSVSGPGVSVSATSVVRGMLSGIPYMISRVTVATDAPLGLRSIMVDDGPSLGAITGGFEVRPANALPGLLRSDEVTSTSPVLPQLATIFPLDGIGPDGFPGTGEGTARHLNGSDDDDHLYVPEVPSGYLDPDAGVGPDVARPLVFYRLTDPNRVLRLSKGPTGRILVTY